MVGIAALLVRLAILPLSPVPQPFIHDEFANLLAADTFASGRLTNPTHPMWIYFESFHITQRPTYMSMYFPAQGMVGAAGKAVAGNPWFGVWLSTGLMCAAMCWMLQRWLPPGWALLGGMIAVMRLALFSYRIDSYNRGACAAIGGALVLGTLPRIMRIPRICDGLWLALGVAILANSRPYEGLLLRMPVVCALVWLTARKALLPAPVLFRRAIAPAALLVVVAGMAGYYNYRVFGDPFTLPYQVNRATYASAPVFLWQRPRPEPVYRYKVMRDFYSRWEMGDFLYARTLTGFLHGEAKKLGTVLLFFFGVALLPPLIMLPQVFRDRRVRFLVAAGTVFGVGLSLNAWLFPRYVGPFACALYSILLQGNATSSRLASRWSTARVSTCPCYPARLPDAGRPPSVRSALESFHPSLANHVVRDRAAWSSARACPRRTAGSPWPATGNREIFSRSRAFRRLGVQRGGHRQIQSGLGARDGYGK